jgi:hypothetical protein
MKTLLIVISLINFAVLRSHAKPDRPIVLSRENLMALRESAEAQAIKNVLSKKSGCTDCVDVFENARNVKSFMVVEKEANGFGGSFVLLVFAKIPKLYRFWLYPIDKNEFEIREAVVQRKLNNELMSEISRKAYADYWIHL